jgi:uncharacterized membrane protein YecN with MAPEG domain
VTPLGFRWTAGALSPNASDRDGHREMIVAAAAIHVGECLTAFVVGVILKQAGLSKSMSSRSEHLFARGYSAEWWALIMRAIK